MTSNGVQSAAARTLPHNLEAEQAVLGAPFIDPPSFAVACSKLGPKDFFRDAHRRIFEVMADLVADGQPLDMILVKEELERKGELDEVGGPAYLASLIDGMPRGTNIEYYAEIVVEKARLRNTIFAANKLLGHAYEADEKAARIIESSMAELSACVANVSGGLISIDDAIAEYTSSITNGSAAAPMPTGFIDLDKVMRGFKRQNLVLVAARPAIGKSSFVMGVAENLAKSGEHVLVFPLEMSPLELASRNLGWRSRVSIQTFEKGEASPEEYQRIEAALEIEGRTPIWIEPTARTVTEITAWSRIAKQKFDNANRKLAVVAVDYIQLCIAERLTGNDTAEMSSISHALLRLSKELDVCVVAVSQLSRAPEARKDKRPQMADLRGSGALEQDAHVVLLIFREEAHKADTDAQGVAEIIIAKNRNGPTGVVKLAFVKELAMFGNLAF